MRHWRKWRFRAAFAQGPLGLAQADRLKQPKRLKQAARLKQAKHSAQEPKLGLGPAHQAEPGMRQWPGI